MAKNPLGISIDDLGDNPVSTGPVNQPLDGGEVLESKGAVPLVNDKAQLLAGMMWAQVLTHPEVTQDKPKSEVSQGIREAANELAKSVQGNFDSLDTLKKAFPLKDYLVKEQFWDKEDDRIHMLQARLTQHAVGKKAVLVARFDTGKSFCVVGQVGAGYTLLDIGNKDFDSAMFLMNPFREIALFVKQGNFGARFRGLVLVPKPTTAAPSPDKGKQEETEAEPMELDKEEVPEPEPEEKKRKATEDPEPEPEPTEAEEAEEEESSLAAMMGKRGRRRSARRRKK
jgi:hypothetical protein